MNKKYIIGIIGLVVIGGIIATVWLFVSGRAVLITKQPSDIVRAVPRACGDDIIKAYNNLPVTSGQDKYAAQLKNIFTSVESLDDADGDPICVMIKYQYYLQVNNYDKAASMTSAMKVLEEKGIFASAELTGVQNASAMQQVVDIMKKAPASEEMSLPSLQQGEGNGRG